MTMSWNGWLYVGLAGMLLVIGSVLRRIVLRQPTSARALLMLGFMALLSVSIAVFSQVKVVTSVSSGTGEDR